MLAAQSKDGLRVVSLFCWVKRVFGKCERSISFSRHALTFGLSTVKGAIVPQSGIKLSMFGRIYEHRALLPVLCGLVFLALCNNTIFWTFCPHLSAKSRHCLTRESSSSSHVNVNSGTMSHQHYGDMAMSDMDGEELPFEASTTSEGETGSLSTTDIEPFPGFDPLLAVTITDAQESCSHCMMHPQSGVNSPSAPIVVNNSTSHDIVPAASSIVWASVASPLTFVDVHDHGPPGLNGSRYILNSTFRI